VASSEDQAGRDATAAAIVRLALARGWLAEHQVEGALRSAGAQGLTLAQLLARHRPDAAQELAVLSRAAPVATTIAPTLGVPPPIAATLAVPAPTPLTHAAARSGAVLVPLAPEDPGRTQVVAALRAQLARDPRFAPHLDLVLERRGVLGEGGMGVVHRVLDKRLGRLAALKVMKTEQAAPQDVARFFREAELTARLDHPSVPPVYEAGTDAAGRPYLLMRLIEGQPLSERIAALHEGGHPPALAEVRELVEVLVKVGEAVARAHARGMVHRDLKPGNVMVGAHGEVLVLDWGLVRVLDGPDDDALLRQASGPAPVSAGAGVELTQAGALLGTPGYMSPEQASGEPVDARTDVFALGAILCAILTSSPPMGGTTVMNMIANTVQGKIARPRDRWRGCPRELDSICAAALAFDRERRTESAEAFVADLRAYLAGEDVPSHRYGLLERLGRGARRRPASVASLAALAVILAVLGGARARVRDAQAFEGAMRRLTQAEGAAARGDSVTTARLVSSAVLLGGDAVRWHGARVLDLAGLSAEGARLLEPMIDDAARPPPLEALFFLHVLQVHAAPDGQGSGRRTSAMQRLIALAQYGSPDDELRPYVAGTLAIERGDWLEAERRLSEALALNPGLGWALVNRAGVLKRLGQEQAALRDLDAALACRNSDPLVLVVALASRSALLVESGRCDEALFDAERALALSPRSRPARLATARALIGAGRLQEAEAAAEAVFQEDDDVDALVLRAIARVKRGVRGPGRADLDAALERSPKHPAALSERILDSVGARDLATARRDARTFLSAWPDDPRASLFAAVVEVSAGARGRAMELLDRAVALAPWSVDALLQRAELKLDSGDFDGASADLEAARTLGPSNARTLIMRAKLRRERRDLDGASADLSAALALAPRDAIGRQLRAEVRAQRGDVAGAIEDLDVARAVVPHEPRFHSMRARLDLEAGDLVCAERHAKLGVDLGGGAYSHLTAAWVARRRGELAAAVGHARRVLELEPGQKEAQAIVDASGAPSAVEDPEVERLVRLGTDKLLAREFAAAEALADQAIERGPRAGTAWVLRARARALQGKVEGARADADRAVEADPAAADGWYIRGSLRVEADPAGGLADSAEALRRDPRNFGMRFLRAQALAALERLDEALAELDGLLAAMPPTHPSRRATEQFRDAIRSSR
jgi:tetratricopeptide (TPR) repeat protein